MFPAVSSVNKSSKFVPDPVIVSAAVIVKTVDVLPVAEYESIALQV